MQTRSHDLKIKTNEGISWAVSFLPWADTRVLRKGLLSCHVTLLPPPSPFCNRDIQSCSTLRRIMRRVYSSVPSFSSVQRWISMGLFAVGTNQQRRNFTGGRVFPRVPVVASSTGVPIRVGVIPSFCILNHNTSTIKYGDKGKVWWMSLKIN